MSNYSSIISVPSISAVRETPLPSKEHSGLFEYYTCEVTIKGQVMCPLITQFQLPISPHWLHGTQRVIEDRCSASAGL